MPRQYREGAVGALADEYEKALNEMKAVLRGIKDEKLFLKRDTSVYIDFQSAGNITLHTIRFGYAYANYIRKKLKIKTARQRIKIDTIEKGCEEIDKMMQYTIDTFEQAGAVTNSKLRSIRIKTSWATYDMEAMIEHAIVHVLRHRLQIEKLLDKWGDEQQPKQKKPKAKTAS